MGPEQIVEPGRVRAFFERHAQGAAQSVHETQNRCRMGGENRLHHQPAIVIQNSRRNACLVYVQTNKLGVIHKGVPFGVAECLKITADYLKRAPFYNAWPTLARTLCPVP